MNYHCRRWFVAARHQGALPILDNPITSYQLLITAFMTSSIIAIDGPVASGKSSIGKRLADRLDYLFFDTGVMYRAVTLLALRELGSAQDPAAVTALARRAHTAIPPPTVAHRPARTLLAGLARC